MAVMHQDKKKQNFLGRFFRSKDSKNRNIKPPLDSYESTSESGIDSPFSESVTNPMPDRNVESFRVFVATWNVGGKSPYNGLNLDHFLHVDHEYDIYVFGFQEIVPLNAGNVLVIEDNEPAAKWLGLINQSLNKVCSLNSKGGSKSTPSFFQKTSLRKISKTFRTESKRRLKTCNCSPDFEKKNNKDICFRCQPANVSECGDLSSEEEEDGSSHYVTGDALSTSASSDNNDIKYGLVACKQMVGIFVTVWTRKELVQHVSHLRISCISRGIMGCLGNKGCISVSMLFFRTSLCFICSHLASGEKEGDQLRRNSDVIEILKNTQFPRICRTPYSSSVPDKILGHDRIIWLGDLNYRISLSYSVTRKLLMKNEWDALLDKDQLKIEIDAGRVFKGWHEGKIYFPPTYKYSYNSDTYAGEMIQAKSKRRTPAWCDRILWHGNGIHQLSYVRGESRFSDHRPVCASFLVDVEVSDFGSRKRSPGPNMKVEIEELLPPCS